MSLLTAYVDTASKKAFIDAGFAWDELAGSAALKYEDTVSTGYSDISSPDNWDAHWAQIVPQPGYKKIRNNLIAIYITPGTFWGTATTAEKQALVRNYVWPSSETTANLDLLYTQAERDDFQKTTMESLDATCEANIRRSNVSGSTKFYDYQSDDRGIVTLKEISTDVELGLIAGSEIPACRVRHSTTQSTTDGTFKLVGFDSEDYDTASMHDTVTNNSRLTVPVSGKYLIQAVIEFAANGTGMRAVYYRINGGADIYLSTEPAVAGASTKHRITAVTIDDLAANDYVEIRVKQTSGGSLNITNAQSHATLTYLGR